MDHRVPKVGLVLALVCSALAALTFIALNEAFEGPSAVDVVARRAVPPGGDLR